MDMETSGHESRPGKIPGYEMGMLHPGNGADKVGFFDDFFRFSGIT
jgi:hypothetical protein